MAKLVRPEVYLVGYTCIDWTGLVHYLKASGNEEFLPVAEAAMEAGLSEGEVLCSCFAKLCYAALSLGHNDNITRVRDVPDNLKACFTAGHGSVFEHATVNFIARNVSRVFSHELVRHRVGTAFSQTSGRYVRGDSIDIVFDPILEPVRQEVMLLQHKIEAVYRQMVEKMGLDQMTDFTQKKKITSALRRLLPNGQSNEIAFSCNLRALRHIVQMRTGRQAEWEIRLVFGDVYRLLKEKFPLLFFGAVEEEVNDLIEVSGMKMQPY